MTSSMRVKDLYEFVMCTYPGVAKLRFESKRKLWSQIFNSAGETVDCHDYEEGAAKYTFTNDLPVEYLDMESNVNYIKSQTVVDAWLGWLPVARAGYEVSGRDGTPKDGR